MRYPDRFATVVPTATGGARDPSRLERIKDLSIWTFHCEDDAPSGVRRTVDSLRAIGGKTHLAETPTGPEIGLHNSWFSAFQEYGALEWMLAQSRGSESSRPAGTLSLAVRWQRYWQEAYSHWYSCSTLLDWIPVRTTEEGCT